MIIQSATLDYHDNSKFIRVQRYNFFDYILNYNFNSIFRISPIFGKQR
jgi:hypothetical protein